MTDVKALSAQLPVHTKGHYNFSFTVPIAFGELSTKT